MRNALKGFSRKAKSKLESHHQKPRNPAIITQTIRGLRDSQQNDRIQIEKENQQRQLQLQVNFSENSPGGQAADCKIDNILNQSYNSRNTGHNTNHIANL